MASGIKLIKALHLHQQFLKISHHRLLRLWRNPNFVWEPPTFGGNAFGGFQNPLKFLGGNQCRGAKPRGNFFNKFGMVDLRGLEPLTSSMPWRRSTKLS